MWDKVGFLVAERVGPENNNPATVTFSLAIGNNIVVTLTLTGWLPVKLHCAFGLEADLAAIDGYFGKVRHRFI